MSTRAPNRSTGIYESRDPSLAQRATLALCAGVSLVLACWLLTGGNISIAASWLGRAIAAGDPLRRAILAAAFVVYYVRLLSPSSSSLSAGYPGQRRSPSLAGYSSSFCSSR
jgi:hypothetical protein